MARRRGPVYRLAAACVFAAASVAMAAPAAAQPFGDAYIAVLSDGATGDVARLADVLVGRHGGVVEHVYRDGIRAFAVRLSAVSASGLRRDPRVASLEALASAAPAPLPDAEPPAAGGKTPASTAPAAVERLPFAPGPGPRLRRVLTPAADRYRVILADTVAEADAARVADRLVRAYGGQRGPVEAAAFRVSMPESSARDMSRDTSVAYVEEQSIAEPADSEAARRASRTLPGQGLRRVAQPVRGRYRLVLRPSVPDDQVEATVDELLRAYEARRHPARSDAPGVILVEMSEPAARALSDDFRVEYVEEQPLARSAGAK